MRRVRPLRFTLVVAALIACIAAASALLADEPHAHKPITVYVVRHAEKLDSDSKDPSLCSRGKERATKLAELFKNEGVTVGRVYHTKWKRSRETFEPVAKAAGKKADDPSFAKV